MSLISIFGILLAFIVTVWVTGKVCYKMGHDAGYEKRRTDEWIKKIRKYREEK